MRNYIVLDTEGVDTVKRKNEDGVHAETSLFYDLGFIVANGDTGEILDNYSFINSDVFFNKSLMTSAYYADKLPQYYEGMGDEWQVADTLTIWRTLSDACKEHNVKNIYAYNARYDMNITNNTIKTMSNGFRTFFTPYNTQWRDIWDIAGATICNTRKYAKWCIEHGYVSAKGNPSTSAETVYRYLTKNDDFIESHTALQDCYIEGIILRKALKRKQKLTKTMGQGWRAASKLAKML